MELKHLLIGLTFGIAAGLTPGPLMALLFSETLKGHKKNGFLVSLSPIITDIPILLLSLLILEKIQKIEFLINVISMIGALFLFYLGVNNLKIKKIYFKKDLHGSLKKGILINLLNPYTYLFWFFVGAPYVEKNGFSGGITFTLSFFTGITASMICIVILTEKLKNILESRYYIYLLKFIGILFIIFGLFLLNDLFNVF